LADILELFPDIPTIFYHTMSDGFRKIEMERVSRLFRQISRPYLVFKDFPGAGKMQIFSRYFQGLVVIQLRIGRSGLGRKLHL